MRGNMGGWVNVRSCAYTSKHISPREFFWSVLDDWNKLDLNIRESNTHTLFKNETPPKAMQTTNAIQLV